MQVKYNLTKSITGEDEKETIHCEFDITDSSIDWLSGQICGCVILVVKKKQCKKTCILLLALSAMSDNGSYLYLYLYLQGGQHAVQR